MDATCASTARATATAACVRCSCLRRYAALSRTHAALATRHPSATHRRAAAAPLSLTPSARARGRVADAGHQVGALQPRRRPLHCGLRQPHRADRRDRANHVRGRPAADGAALDPRLGLVRGAAGARHRGRRRHAALCVPAHRVPDHDQRAQADVEAGAAHDHLLGLPMDAAALRRRDRGARHRRLGRQPLRVVHEDGRPDAEHEQPARQRCGHPEPRLLRADAARAHGLARRSHQEVGLRGGHDALHRDGIAARPPAQGERHAVRCAGQAAALLLRRRQHQALAHGARRQLGKPHPLGRGHHRSRQLHAAPALITHLRRERRGPPGRRPRRGAAAPRVRRPHPVHVRARAAQPLRFLLRRRRAALLRGGRAAQGQPVVRPHRPHHRQPGAARVRAARLPRRAQPDAAALRAARRLRACHPRAQVGRGARTGDRACEHGGVASQGSEGARGA